MPRTAYGQARQGTTTVNVEYEVPDEATNESVMDVFNIALDALLHVTGEESNEAIEVSAEII